MNANPILTTQRLILREATLDDAAFFLELMNSPTWIAQIGNRGIATLEHAANYIQNSLLRHYAAHGFGLWVVALLENGQPIGIFGILRRNGLDDPDIGFAYLPEFEGKGYGIEIGESVLDHARNVLGLSRLLAITTTGNIRSQRLLERLGFAFERMAVLPGDPAEMMLFANGKPQPAGEPAVSDLEQIDALVRDYYGVFCNKDGATAQVDRLYGLFIAEGVLANNSYATPLFFRLEDFVAPRIEVFRSGRLQEFEEHECSAETVIVRKIASRLSQYEKSGILEGTAFHTRGTKMMQFVKTPKGWRFSAVTWDDEV